MCVTSQFYILSNTYSNCSDATMMAAGTATTTIIVHFSGVDISKTVQLQQVTKESTICEMSARGQNDC